MIQPRSKDYSYFLLYLTKFDFRFSNKFEGRKNYLLLNLGVGPPVCNVLLFYVGLGGLRISAPAVPQTGFTHQASAPVIPAVSMDGAMVVEDESVGLRGLHPGKHVTLICHPEKLRSSHV